MRVNVSVFTIARRFRRWWFRFGANKAFHFEQGARILKSINNGLVLAAFLLANLVFISQSMHYLSHTANMECFLVGVTHPKS